MVISTNLFIYLPAFLDTGLPRGMYTNGTQAPGEVSSLPNPTTLKGWLATPPGSTTPTLFE